MNTQSLPIRMVQAPSLPGPHQGYMSGFGNDYETEALPGALPQGMNSPQKCNYGLYGEQLSGTTFAGKEAPLQDDYIDCWDDIEKKFDGTPGKK